MTNTNQLTNHYFRSLNRNIILIIITVSVIPLVIVSSTIYYHFRTSYREKVYTHLRELVHNHTQNIDNFLKEKLGDIRFLASSYGWDRMRDEPLLQDRLAALQRGFNQVFVDLGVINAGGEQIAYAGPFKLAKADYSDAEWFRQAIQSEYYISDVFLGLRGLPHFIVAVRNGRQGNYWILRATIDFVKFNTLVENIRLGETGFAFILNRQGQLQTTQITKKNIDIVPDKDIYAEFLANPPAASNKIRIVVKPDSFNRENIYVAGFLKNGDWLLVYQQRVADAFADLGRTFMITTFLMFAGVLGIIVMAFTLSQRIVRRVTKADEEKQMMGKKVVEAGKLASVGELAAGIAHEINNPVAIMVEEAGWMGDLLEEEEFRESENLTEFARAIKQIQTQGKRCKEITHKLLSFARKTDTTVQEINIKDLLEELVALSGQRAKYSMVEIHTNLSDNLPSLKLSVTELQQVFFNLINNAIDAMDNGGGVLTISSERKENHLLISISDTGKGIPEANLDRLFDPFFTTKPVGKGTGLGLSICYGIIDKMGGKIEVESTVGVGTTFLVYIPFTE